MDAIVQVELVKQAPLIIGAVGVFIVAVGGLGLQFLTFRKIAKVEHNTNSLVEQRVGAAKAEGRADERFDQLERDSRK